MAYQTLQFEEHLDQVFEGDQDLTMLNANDESVSCSDDQLSRDFEKFVDEASTAGDIDRFIEEQNRKLKKSKMQKLK